MSECGTMSVGIMSVVTLYLVVTGTWFVPRGWGY